ncbi:hypothetical protein MOQ_002778 [Trypanosoma cruzi marinkellei]|uniref:Uncharacterized protein n=1 Tax=Trypanosoma cruzi marinkellei TaxID=85056 RepID=K2NWS6_TRYCR|nr:hypothetical protein MOQ_002778 [Trypanosoma cruzi marinkellei]
MVPLPMAPTKSSTRLVTAGSPATSDAQACRHEGWTGGSVELGVKLEAAAMLYLNGTPVQIAGAGAERIPCRRRAECIAPYSGLRKPLGSIPRTGSAPCSASILTGSHPPPTALQKRVPSWHLTRHIVDSGRSCSASSVEERAHGCGLSFATAAYPRTNHVKHKPGRRPASHSSKTHGSLAWPHCPNTLFVPDGSSQKPTAPPSQATGNPRARTPSSLVGKRPQRPASAAGFCTNTDGRHGHCNPPFRAHAVGLARMLHSGHAKNLTRKRLLLPLDPAPP